jgi:hypothetical protein
VATYGFHSVTAVLALILLTCGRITLHLSHTNFTHSGLHDTDRINAEKAQKRWRAPAGREQGFSIIAHSGPRISIRTGCAAAGRHADAAMRGRVTSQP